MIGQLTGLLIASEADHCMIDVNGVGYVVYASTQTLSKLRLPPETSVVLIETIVREDAITLFGFSTVEERNWFRLLTTVQGVGSKVALAILSVCPSETLPTIIASADKTQLTRATGVGPRLAARILSELNGKYAAISTTLDPTRAATITSHAPTLAADAMVALEGLGFRRAEGWDVLQRVIAAHPDAAVDEVLRLSLRELGR